eukprot:366313-Chlamydomonas_euryale.AAC.6
MLKASLKDVKGKRVMQPPHSTSEMKTYAGNTAQSFYFIAEDYAEQMFGMPSLAERRRDPEWFVANVLLHMANLDMPVKP